MGVSQKSMLSYPASSLELTYIPGASSTAVSSVPRTIDPLEYSSSRKRRNTLTKSARPVLQEEGPRNPRHFFVPMAFIAGIQRQEFWDTLNGDADRLRVPRAAGFTYYYRGKGLDIELFTKLPVCSISEKSLDD